MREAGKLMQIECGYNESEDGKTITLGLTLTREEFEAWLMLMGLAAGTATSESMSALSYTALRLANKMNEGNPNWRPYWVPEEAGHGTEVAHNPYA
jgi:hypothetical protein